MAEDQNQRNHKNSETSANTYNLEQQNPSLREQIMANRGQKDDGELATSQLHTAARFEQVDTVRRLIRAGDYSLYKADMNIHGYTPLHFAAMAINPNAEIAKMLIQSVHGKRGLWLNAQTLDRFGGNTALHLAAANVNVTRDFVQHFEQADSLLLNSENDTPYHVAAKSSNPEAIIHMLQTFSPTNNDWDVDKVDRGNVDKVKKPDEVRKPKDKVINICARNGNAKAVALLIKHGADISRGVLHEIVLESVRNPEKIGNLLSVYQTIVDNAVTWRGLEQQADFLKVKGSDCYMELFRKIMIWLLTTPVGKNMYGGKNVVQCALEHGAYKMFWRIINTKYVFRTDGDETRKWLGEISENDATVDTSKKKISDKQNDIMKSRYHWTVFDVTNFVKETIPPKDVNSDKKTAGCKNTENIPLTSSESAVIGNEIQHMDQETTQPNNVPNERNFDDLPALSRPYLADLLLAFDQWRSSKVLRRQPLKELTQPYITMLQRLYLILGLIQIVFMVCFTAFHMPTPCSLARLFNASSALCNSTGSSSIINSVNTDISVVSHQRSWTSVLWLIWPVILIAATLLTTFYYVKQVSEASKKQSEKLVVKSKDLRLSVWRKCLPLFRHLLLPTLFCIAVFVWANIYLAGKTYDNYVEISGMVLLFGWIVTLYFLGAVSQNFSIFTLVLGKIIAKDMPSFMLFFGFTVVAFTFAMHALRMSVCSPNEFMADTFFSVLSSAFGIGDFFEATMTDSTCAGASTLYLFEIIYFLYICATMIILLNVLIAMMNHRYEKARPKAENIRRCQMLSIMTALERHKTLSNVLKKCLMPNRPDISYSYEYGNRGSLFFNNKLRRWYLRLVLPVDEQIKKR